MVGEEEEEEEKNNNDNQQKIQCESVKGPQTSTAAVRRVRAVERKRHLVVLLQQIRVLQQLVSLGVVTEVDDQSTAPSCAAVLVQECGQVLTQEHLLACAEERRVHIAASLHGTRSKCVPHI